MAGKYKKRSSKCKRGVFKETMLSILISWQKFSTIIVSDLFYPPKKYGFTFEKRLLDFEPWRSDLPAVAAMPIINVRYSCVYMFFLVFHEQKTTTGKKSSYMHKNYQQHIALERIKQLDLAINRRFRSSSVFHKFCIMNKKWILFLPGKLRCWKLLWKSFLSIVWDFFLRNYTRHA